MPSYRFPGVFVEETSAGPPPIVGVATAVTAFVGPAARGPVDRAPLLRSYAAYTQAYGGDGDLRIGGGSFPNHLARAARAFFDQGGHALYVVRVLAAGCVAATADLAGAGDPARTIRLRAMSPGMRELTATFALERRAVPKDDALQRPGALVEVGGQYWVVGDDPGTAGGSAVAALGDGDAVTLVTLSATITGADGQTEQFTRLGLDRRDPAAVQRRLGDGQDAISALVLLDVGASIDAITLCRAFEAHPTVTLSGGSDGDGPPEESEWQRGFARVGELDDAALVAAPGAAALPSPTPTLVNDLLLTIAEAPESHVFAVLDPPPGLGIAELQALRASIGARHGALYYPWLYVADPAAPGGRRDVAPSGVVCGLYARSDAARGVWRVAGEEAVTGVTGLAAMLDDRQQAVLTPLGINLFRIFPGRGLRLWGARTLCADPEWRYVGISRYRLYLARSLARGLDWATFEPNGAALWARITQSANDFLLREWHSGALQGVKPRDAFYVRCDRTAISQADLDAGRAVIEYGVALLRPGEFVITRVRIATAEWSGL